MKIKGIPVGTTMPRPDWNQDNPKRADYIKNKPIPDTTLSVSGRAADAKATGEAIAEAMGKTKTDTTLAISGMAADAQATGNAISASILTATDDGTGFITFAYGGEVKPGEGGGGGCAVSPTIEVTEIDGGHMVTVTDVDGSESFNVMDGKDGQPGADGYTPKKGVDYYTEADKQEMVNDVLSALPTWEGGSY